MAVGDGRQCLGEGFVESFWPEKNSNKLGQPVRTPILDSGGCEHVNLDFVLHLQVEQDRLRDHRVLVVRLVILKVKTSHFKNVTTGFVIQIDILHVHQILIFI
jgi:hypothetical protein